MNAVTASPPATEFVIDPTGFPMIRVPAPANARDRQYIHWLPVSKIQFEHFIADQQGTVFDQDRYKLLLAVHGKDASGKELPGRVAPGAVTRDNYYRAFVTGVFPSEVELYLDWINEDAEGHRYDLLTGDEWKGAFDALAKGPAVDTKGLFAHDRVTARALVLAAGAARVAGEMSGAAPTTVEQMLMTRGVMEWVRWSRATDQPQFGGRGRPHHTALATDVKDFCSTPAPAEPGPGYEKTRLRGFGFRLIRKDSV